MKSNVTSISLSQENEKRKLFKREADEFIKSLEKITDDSEESYDYD